MTSYKTNLMTSYQEKVCRETEGFKQATAAINNKILNIICIEQKSSDSFHYNEGDTVTYMNSEGYYTCPPFIHKIDVIGSECPEDYSVANSYFIGGTQATECASIISDATIGTYLYADCVA